MGSARQYLLSIIAAAIICAVVRALTHNKGTSGAIINLTTGVFLILAVITPWKDWSLSGLGEYINNYSVSAETVAGYGVTAAETEIAAIIKTQTETYIVDKAKSFGVLLQADVTLDNTSPGVPKSVVLTAQASPYLKQKISQFITTDLGIPEADQVWT